MKSKNFILLFVLVGILVPVVTASSIDVEYNAYKGVLEDGSLTETSTSISNFNALGFDFASSSFSNPEGDDVWDKSTSSDTVLIEMPTDTSHNYGTYIYKPGYRVWEATVELDGGETGGPYSRDIYLAKQKDCKSSFSYSLSQNKISTDESIDFSISADSAADHRGPITYVPSRLSSNYYSMETEIGAKIKDSDGTLVDDPSKTISIPFGETKTGTVTWNPSTNGDYTAKVYTKPTDSKCSSSVESSSSESIEVVDDEDPQISGASPTGTIGSDSTTITADFSDNIELSSYSLDLDGGNIASGGLSGTSEIKSYSASGLPEGSHTYTWTVSDSAGNTVTQQESFTVNINNPPTASFNTNSPVSTGEDFGLDASGSSDPDGDSLNYDWDTDNDGNYDDANGKTPSVSKNDDGSYTIGLKVSDGNGGTDTTSETVNVDNRGPSVSFSKYDDDPLTDESVTFSASANDQDGSISDYNWNIGGSGSSVSNSWGDDGSYSVRVTVTDDDGATASDSISVNVQNRPPSSSFSFTPSSPDKGESISFDGSSSSDPDGSISSYNWDWDDDDNYESSGGTSSHSYSSYGDYSVTLKTEDDDGSTSTSTRTVSVSESIDPSISNPSPTGNIGTNIPSISADFSDNNQLKSYILKLDGLNVDSGSLSGTSGSASYTTSRLGAGSHSYTWEVKDSFDNTDALSETFSIDKDTPTGSLTGSNISYPEKTSLNFNQTNTGDSDVFYTLYKDNTLIENSTGNFTYEKKFAVDDYNFKINTSGGVNWTSKELASKQIGVKRGKTGIDLFLNGSRNSDSTIEYGQETNATAKINISENGQNDFNLYLNGSQVGSQTGQEIRYLKELSAGVYNFTAIYTGNKNYSSKKVTSLQTIEKQDSNLTLEFNGSSNNVTYGYNETAGINASLPKENNLEIQGNLTGLNTGSFTRIFTQDLILDDLGVFNISASYPGDENHTMASEKRIITVEDLTAPTLGFDNQTLDVGEGLEYNITAFDNVPGTVLQWKNPSISGFEINNSGWIKNTTKLDSGDYNIDVNVSDGRGNYNSSVFGLEVIPFSILKDARINGTLKADGEYQNISGIVNTTINSSNISYSSLEDSYIYNSSINDSTVINCDVIDTELNGVSCEDAFVDPSSLNNVTFLGGNITHSTVNDSVINNSKSLNSNITEYSTVQDSNVTNSTISRSKVMDFSSVLSSSVVNSTTSKSNITSSNITDSSKIDNSKVFKTSVYKSNVSEDSSLSDSSLNSSEVRNSTVKDSSVQNNSNITNSNIDNSNIQNSTLDNSKAVNSTLNNSTLRDSDISSNSNISNSQLENMTVSNATIVNNTVTEGKINYNDTEYDYSNGTSNDTLEDVYRNKPPKIIYNAPTTLEVNEEGSFDASGAYDPDGNITKYTWSFEDGYKTNNKSFKKSFSSDGNYQVNLSLKDSFGGTKTTSFTIDVLTVSSGSDDDDDDSSGSSSTTSSSSTSLAFTPSTDENETSGKNNASKNGYNFTVKQTESQVQNISLEAEEGENITLRLENLSSIKVSEPVQVRNGSIPVNLSAPLNVESGAYNGSLRAEWRNSSGENNTKRIPLNVDVRYKSVFFDVNLTTEGIYQSGDEINTSIDIFTDEFYRDNASLSTKVYSENDVIRNNTRNVSIESSTMEEVFFGLAGDYMIKTEMSYRNRSVSDNESIEVVSDNSDDDNIITGSFSGEDQSNSLLTRFVSGAINFISSFSR